MVPFEKPSGAIMSQPTPYTRQSDFTDWSQDFPERPHDGTALDSEFNAIKTTLDQTLGNLGQIQRDDGELANQTVGAAQLKQELLASLGVASIWATSTTYAVGDVVFQGDAVYECLVAHTSGTFATDLAAAKWQLLTDFSEDRLTSSSTTSNSVGTGSKTFTVSANKLFTAGAFVLVVDTLDTANFMHGTITTYTGTSLTINVTTTGGSGTKTSWTVSVSGPKGATGATGADGASGNNLIKVSTDDTTPNFLEDKFVVGSGLTLTTNNPGANETRQLDINQNVVTASNIYLNQNFY